MLDYCLGSLLWSAFFFALGYLACLAVVTYQDRRNSLGETSHDDT